MLRSSRRETAKRRARERVCVVVPSVESTQRSKIAKIAAGIEGRVGRDRCPPGFSVWSRRSARGGVFVYTRVVSPPYVVAAFYRFAALAHASELKAELTALGSRLKVGGTLLLASEGINGTVSGERAAVDVFLRRLRAEPGFAALTVRESASPTIPFMRLKVRLKREIVTLGQPSVDPLVQTGAYVEPDAWNALLADPDVVLIDTRNDYEVRIGSFRGAIDPKIPSFRSFPAWATSALSEHRDRKIAMFCTGGIRCEKASAYLMGQGFEQVFQLRGGILNYLETVPAEASHWTGECFVFDARVAVDHALHPGRHTLCYGCKEPLAPEDLDAPGYESGVTCGRCVTRTSPEVCDARRERVRQTELARARGAHHLGSLHVT